MSAYITLHKDKAMDSADNDGRAANRHSFKSRKCSQNQSSRSIAAMDVRPDPLTLTEIEQLAQRHLPRSTYDYYACGDDDETVLRRNTLIYSR